MPPSTRLFDSLCFLETTPCEQNPCKHNGLCTPLSSTRYVCDCSASGYQGINCDIGHITTPKYPQLSTGIPSSSLMFRSSPLNSGYLVLTPSSRDITFFPSFLKFNSSSSLQSLKVVSKKPGVHFIKYTISGSNAAEFDPPENDVIFVDVIRNSTSETLGNSTTSLRLPVGCHEILMRNCSASSGITSSSTASWETTGALTSSSGVVVVHAGEASIPLSFLGASLFSERRSPDEKSGQCNETQTYSIAKLIQNNVLVKSFLEALKSSFPKWLTAKVRRIILAKSLHPSDVSTQLLSGKKLRQTTTGQGQPIAEESLFSVLHSSKIDVTVENDTDYLRSRDERSQISLAVDLCGGTSKTIILRFSNKYAALLQNSSALKRLKKNGWELTVSSIQISKANSIRTSFGEKSFWDGAKVIRRNSGVKGGSLALSGKLKKSFAGNGISSYLYFHGTMVISVPRVDSVSIEFIKRKLVLQRLTR